MDFDEANFCRYGYNSDLIKARWQSGYAAACKAVDVGSIPILASGLSPGGGIGRRYGLKIR